MARRRDFTLLTQFKTVLIEAVDAKVWLGRLVKDFLDPRAFNTPRTPITPPLACKTDDTFINVRALLNQQRGNDFILNLCDALNLDDHAAAENSMSFEAKKVRHLRLDSGDDDDVLRMVLGIEEVKEKVRKWKLPLYFVVGVLLTPSNLTMDTSAASQDGIRGAVDPTKAASMLGVTGTQMPVAAAQVTGSHQTSDTSQVQATAIGSRVFAFEYKVISKQLVTRAIRMSVTGPQSDQAFSDGESDEEDREEDVDINDFFLVDEPLGETQAAAGNQSIFSVT